MQQSNKPCQNFKVLEFNYPELFNKAMTFKQYHQEYTARNKDHPLKLGINENLIELGSDLIDFYFHDFFTFQEYVFENLIYYSLPNKDHNTFSSYSEIRKQKQQLLSEKNLAEVAIQLGLKNQMLVSINQNSDLKNNQRIQSQALKALIGAQYFDKQKDLNLLRKLMIPIFQDLIKKSLVKIINIQNESMNLHKQENFKGVFKEYMDKHPEYTYKLVFQESLNQFEQNRKIYQYELLINDVLPLKRTGEQKKAVEAQVFKDALQLLKTDQFQQLLEDSMKNQNEIAQESGIGESQVQSHIHNNLKFVEKLEQLEQSLQQKQQLNEKEELGRLVDSFLLMF